MKVCAYARVSTKHQSLGQQLQAIERFCEYKGFILKKTYKDTGSGKNTKRPDYLSMVKALRRMEYAGVVVFRLDRLGRNLREMVLLIEELESRGIKVFSVNESFDTSTAMGRAMMQLVMVFAEFEREQTSEATIQRLKALKAAGVKLGREKAASPWQIRKARRLHQGGLSINRVSQKLNLSYGTTYAIIKKRGVYGDKSESEEKEGNKK